MDAAVLFHLALERGTAGATCHGVAEHGVRTKDSVTVVGERLKLPVEGKSLDEAIGFMAHLISWDDPTSSVKTYRVASCSAWVAGGDGGVLLFLGSGGEVFCTKKNADCGAL